MWTIKIDSRVEKELKKLDKVAQKKIINYLKEKVISQENPRLFGKSLQGNKQGLWRYRVGDYRIIPFFFNFERYIPPLSQKGRGVGGEGIDACLSLLLKNGIICQILDRELVILVVKVGHRKNIYLD